MIANTSPFSEQSDRDNGRVDAINLLVADHSEVNEMFIEYHELARGDGTQAELADLVDQICQALLVHATLEEELFYPAARSALGSPALIEKAEQEHAQATALIDRLQDMDPADDRYDSTMQQLQEAVEEHVQEEEQELFPQVRQSSLDVLALGLQMAERRDEVLSRIDEEGIED